MVTKQKSKKAGGSSTADKKAKNTLKRSSGNNLVIVESPAKARTIERILGSEYTVRASQGHVRDLPKGKLGVKVEDGFSPSYSVMKDKETIVQELKKLGNKATSIYLATDPDREGEAIAWHVIKAAAWEGNGDHLQRVVFHEITHDAVRESFKHPRSIDMELVNAQQARRILDRLVGYQISPLLWKKVQRGLSAGRVQSVALRMVVERQREIEAFVKTEYWSIEARLRKMQVETKGQAVEFGSTLHSIKGQKGKLNISDGDFASSIEWELAGARYAVDQVKKREVKQSPSPPFITSTLQQEAYRKLRFSAKRTMMVAQQLYEGLTVDDEGAIGLITYMRTDSTQVNPGSVKEAREYIVAKYGDEYVPPQPRVFRKKSKGAQEAHEGIRPTSVLREPRRIRSHLSNDQARLYDLIWQRMLASQMADAKSDSTTVDIRAECVPVDRTYIFRSTGSVLKFPGFRALYLEGKDDAEEDSDKAPLPELFKDVSLELTNLESNQHFTQPPALYSEATLIKVLEELGIGRPSTYAPIISTITDRHYVQKEEGRLKPTMLGEKVCDLLVQYFNSIMDTSFTAKMEGDLDEVAQGGLQLVPMLSEFYGPFSEALELANEAMPRVKIEEATDEICEKCGEAIVIKIGRFGKFLACTNFPTCRNTKPVAGEGAAPETQGPAVEETIDEQCEKCGQPMEIRSGRFGRFIACSDYPTCKTSKPILNKVGVACPKCGGDIVQRRSRGRGRVFYGCSTYPECDFVANQRPLPDPCPECGGLMVAVGTDGTKCTVCTWTGDVEAREPATAG